MIYIAGSSVARLTKTFTYAGIIKATFLNSFHSFKIPRCSLGLYTVLSADEETESLKLNDGDFIIFHFGHNDCIYRKDKKVHTDIYKGLMELSLEQNSKYYQFFKNCYERFSVKDEDELLQMITFEEFESTLDKVLSRFDGKQCIVISINYMDSLDENYYAINELKKTNEILKQQSLKHGAHYIDMFKPPKLTWEGTHLTEEGHKIVAEKIQEHINEVSF